MREQERVRQGDALIVISAKNATRSRRRSAIEGGDKRLAQAEVNAGSPGVRQVGQVSLVLWPERMRVVSRSGIDKHDLVLCVGCCCSSSEEVVELVALVAAKRSELRPLAYWAVELSRFSPTSVGDELEAEQDP